MDGLKNTDINVVLHYYENSLIKEYLSLLDDTELDIVGVNIITTNIINDKESLLKLIRKEKVYRYYRNNLEGVKGSKTK